MKNPFAPHDGRVKKNPRNAFDLSHQRLDTTEFGLLKPNLCMEVIPDDSIELEGSIGIRGMPTCFPLQTRIRASVSYFYVRNRTLCKDFEDFIFKTKESKVMPWLKLNNSRAKRMISTGSLGDSLGVPSTVGTSDSYQQSIAFSLKFTLGDAPSNFLITRNDFITAINDYPHSLVNTALSWGSSDTINLNTYFYYYLSQKLENLSPNLSISFPISNEITVGSSSTNWALVLFKEDSENQLHSVYANSLSTTYGTSSVTFSATLSDGFLKKAEELKEFRIGLFYVLRYQGKLVSNVTSTTPTLFFIPSLQTEGSSSVLYNFSNPVTISTDSILDATDDRVISQNVFVGDTPSVPLSALPFRAYEMICNYYFRNDLNNPYVLNGEVQYNQFIPTYDGGPDTNVYDYHYKNWEMDMFTSALQSPQFGIAPLVGLTYSGSDTAVFKFTDTDSHEYSARLAVDDDGHLVSVVDFDKDIPSGNLRGLMSAVQLGMSINDFRNVNAFQRFKENMQRRSLRYRNQLKSHLNVNVDYPDIDVPQYIGGFSGYLETGQNTNVADSPDAGLGDFNGSLGGILHSNHKIRVYCPEHGFIIGIVSLTPIPVYSQSIDKFFLKSDAFDYFQSEFSKIGFVPIHYSEVTPLQNLGLNQSPSDVFGYQRAWYDYMSIRDSVHGDFRTTLQQFTLGRTFAERPTLVEDFVRVKPDQLNEIFVANNIADRYNSNAKFLLNIFNKVTALRQIPRNGVPSLE